MDTTSRLVQTGEARASVAEIADVRIGLGYTTVRLEDGRTGLAYTFRNLVDDCCSVLTERRPLAGRPAQELVRWLVSDDPIEAAVGLATINAVTVPEAAVVEEGDAQGRLDLRLDDDVGMVGHFEPMVESLRARVGSLTIFERIDTPEGILRPAEEAQDALRHCDVAFLTATTVVNHTLDPLLEAARGCREVALLGASTPLIPEVFAGTAVTLLSGVVVKEPEETLRVVSEGGGTRRLRPFLRKVNVRVSAPRVAT